ncbi:LysR family transcriptional regulator [Phyllobacterium sp. OV277]|uniref:LysR family transcriptional regulator n=1 Tax=Phyllobacterium sp. OV277 TaxID=1882772 RepID=UPI000882D1A9|nr:LysR family transcriptional regulator [Phyllobacterium sp. OV277]SDP69744.1 transcriptional regulator, LysR family [Phyllobacterium sp. OV277]
MDRLIFRDLSVFEVVARHQSFTAAAAELGISQSALSYTVSQLEKRIGVPLLTRTTRNVSPTEAGQQLLGTLGPALRDIADQVQALKDQSMSISGTIRLTMVSVAYETILRPILCGFYAKYPNVSVEVSINEGLSDIVSEGFDGGIRFGTLVDRDMVALSLTTSTPVVIVGAPAYFERNGPMPQTPSDLTAHRCITYRFVSSTRLYRWPLAKNGQAIDFKTDGTLILNDGEAIRTAAIDGLGLAFLFESQISQDVVSGRLIRVLADWLPELPGFSLYYPSRRRTTSAFRALIDYIRG